MNDSQQAWVRWATEPRFYPKVSDHSWSASHAPEKHPDHCQESKRITRQERTDEWPRKPMHSSNAMFQQTEIMEDRNKRLAQQRHKPTARFSWRERFEAAVPSTLTQYWKDKRKEVGKKTQKVRKKEDKRRSEKENNNQSRTSNKLFNKRKKQSAQLSKFKKKECAAIAGQEPIIQKTRKKEPEIQVASKHSLRSQSQRFVAGSSIRQFFSAF